IVKVKWYLDKVLGDCTIYSLFKTICIECEINIESRNISSHSDKHKKETIAKILNKLINTTPSNKMAQDLSINTILSNKIAQDSIEQINSKSNNNKELQSIRSEDDEL
ncbi:11633_t:CDS:2, partial [Gigaspora margarita]